MQHTNKPVCYYPTTVVLVDDDRKYLKSLGFILDVKKMAPRFFSNPQEALDFLQKYKPVSFVDKCLIKREDVRIDHRTTDLDLRAIRAQIYNPNRFSEISVVIVDYAMPSLNGLELCSLIRDKPFKILLLTGEAGEEIAVKAFNEGIIDKFIRKDATDFQNLLSNAIFELQQQYFQNLSKVVVDALSDEYGYPLNDPVLIQLFDQIYQKNELSEYYLTDEYGSYLFLDIEGNPSWLAIKNEDGMEGAYQVAKHSDTHFPEKILTAMENREKILYLYDEGGLTDDPVECQKSLYPAEKLLGNKTYYYSYIINSNAYDIHRDKVLPYEAYLEKL